MERWIGARKLLNQDAHGLCRRRLVGRSSMHVLTYGSSRTGRVSRIHDKDRHQRRSAASLHLFIAAHSDVVSALPSVSWASTNSVHLLRRLGRKTGAFTPFLSSHRPLSSQSCISCTRGAIGSWSSVLSLSLALVAHFPTGPPPCNVVRTRFASLSSRPPVS